VHAAQFNLQSSTFNLQRQFNIMDADLLAYARDASARGDDLFAILGTDATSSESDIRRAFRKRALTAHPDKAGDAYDPALYERLERARDVLTNPEARKIYDDGIRAILQKKVQLEQMTSRRRKLVEELEQREQEAKRAKMDAANFPVQRDPEREAMAARGRAKLEERRRLMREAEERERLAHTTASNRTESPPAQPPMPESEAGRAASPTAASQVLPKATTTDDYDERIADIERRIREKEERRAARKAKKAVKKQPSSPPSSFTNYAPEANSCKQPSDIVPSASLSSSAIPQNHNNKFAATMERLKAAQARRNEEKRRGAEEEAKVPAVPAEAL